MALEIPQGPPTPPRKPSSGRPKKTVEEPKQPEVVEPTPTHDGYPVTQGNYPVGNGNGTLQEPDFDIERFGDYMDVLQGDFLVNNFDERKLTVLAQDISDCLDRCRKRLQAMQQQRTALVCSNCQKPLPGGRFAGEIVIQDHLTGELQALRACCEACYREVSRIANERRARHQGSSRGTVAM